MGEYMSNEISNWIALIAAVTSFMAYLETKKVTCNNMAIEALRIVIEAAEKTETYCRLRAEGAARVRRTENELAELWSRASVLVRKIDSKLAFRLGDKSRFWRDPDTWSDEQIQQAGISLQSVKKNAERLLDIAA
jgi:hypothetical protein